MTAKSNSASILETGNAGPQDSRSGVTSKLIYGLVIFSCAFLLFQVQPILAKVMLPWFGGSAAVWVVCLLFFQVVLLLGYSYAHWLTRNFAARYQARIHAALLVASLLVLPILPKDSWKPSTPFSPALHILWLLAVNVGLPYFLLSSTSPLLQAWYAQKDTHTSPYRFYAVSNIGSMLALVSYPIVMEPWFATSHQAVGWSWAYAAVALYARGWPLLLLVTLQAAGKESARLRLLGRCKHCGSAWPLVGQPCCWPSPTTLLKTLLRCRFSG